MLTRRRNAAREENYRLMTRWASGEDRGQKRLKKTTNILTFKVEEGPSTPLKSLLQKICNEGKTRGLKAARMTEKEGSIVNRKGNLLLKKWGGGGEKTSERLGKERGRRRGKRLTEELFPPPF